MSELDDKLPIGAEQVAEATAILQKYKAGKAALDKRIVDNELWFRMGHWKNYQNPMMEGKPQPASGWLFNSIANKHADAMDNYPAPNVLPRAADDAQTAQVLSSILPVVLEQADYEQVYSDTWWRKLKQGTGVKGVFWDPEARGGVGEIAIRPMNLLMLYWEPGVADIQASPHFFSLSMENTKQLESRWPQLKGHSASVLDVPRFLHDGGLDTTEKSVVVDWYYKKKQNKKTVLHYCKFVGETVLYATENENGEGWYDHGKYPFVFDPMFRVKGTPCGFGYIDIGKGAQEYIDRGDQAVMQNMLSNAKPRYFVRSDGSVNEQEYADMTKDFVHTDGNLGQDSILPVVGKVLNSIYLNVLDRKVDELKETTGNRDVSTGGSTSGVTAASAIAAMQEAGSKLSRDGNKAAYRAFREVVELVVELIRQFYDLPRQFRILGENGREDFVSYTNAGIKPVYQGMEMGVDMGYRLPVFDIEITAEKASPYSKLSQNELALQFFGAGFFNPQMTDQALACLEMMDFDGKEQIMQRISANGTLYQRLMMAQQQAVAMAQLVDMKLGTNYAMQLLGGAQGAQQPMPGSVPDIGNSGGESSVTANARKEAADRAAPV